MLQALLASCVFIAAVLPAAIGHRHYQKPRLLEEFDFFERYCQSEGASFLQCFTALDDPDACSDCHLKYIGRGYDDFSVLAVSGSACQKQCASDYTEDQFGSSQVTGCNELGIAAVNCVNGKIWGYHCRDEFNAFEKCDEGDCSKQSLAFEECLGDGFKVLRGQSLAKCEEMAQTFDTCLGSKYNFLQGTEEEACEKCHSDVGFGFRNDTCDCTKCNDEGSDVSLCIQENIRCPDKVRGEITCLEKRQFCPSSPCFDHDLDLSDINWPKNEYPQNNFTFDQEKIDEIWEDVKEAQDKLKEEQEDANEDNSGVALAPIFISLLVGVSMYLQHL